MVLAGAGAQTALAQGPPPGPVPPLDPDELARALDAWNRGAANPNGPIPNLSAREAKGLERLRHVSRRPGSALTTATARQRQRQLLIETHLHRERTGHYPKNMLQRAKELGKRFPLRVAGTLTAIGATGYIGYEFGTWANKTFLKFNLPNLSTQEQGGAWGPQDDYALEPIAKDDRVWGDSAPFLAGPGGCATGYLDSQPWRCSASWGFTNVIAPMHGVRVVNDDFTPDNADHWGPLARTLYHNADHGEFICSYARFLPFSGYPVILSTWPKAPSEAENFEKALRSGFISFEGSARYAFGNEPCQGGENGARSDGGYHSRRIGQFSTYKGLISAQKDGKIDPEPKGEDDRADLSADTHPGSSATPAEQLADAQIADPEGDVQPSMTEMLLDFASGSSDTDPVTGEQAAPSKVTVPSCAGDLYAECAARLQAHELVPVRTTVTMPEVDLEKPAGAVLSIDPAGGAQVDPGTTVTVRTNPDEADYPKVVPRPLPGETAEQYRVRVADAGWPDAKIHVITLTEATADPDLGPNVVVRTQPPPETRVRPQELPEVEIYANPPTMPPPDGGGGGGGTGGCERPPIRAFSLPALADVPRTFPFGIPFWIADALDRFVGAGTAPKFTFTFLGYSLTVDMKWTQPAVNVVRPVIIICAAIGMLVALANLLGGFWVDRKTDARAV